MGTDWSRPTWTCPPELSLPTSMVWGLQVNPPRSCCLLPTESVNFHLPAHGLSSFPSPSQSRSFPPMKSSPFQIHPWSIPANRALVAPPRAQSCLLVCFFTSPAAIDSSFFFSRGGRKCWPTEQSVRLYTATGARVSADPTCGSQLSQRQRQQLCPLPEAVSGCLCSRAALMCCSWDQKCCVKGASRSPLGASNLDLAAALQLGHCTSIPSFPIPPPLCVPRWPRHRLSSPAEPSPGKPP